MKLIILHETDYASTKWAGGTTKQLLLLPPKATYAKRNFDLRISIASIQIPASDFTPLPGINRNFVLLKGALLLNINKKGKQLLLPGDVIDFKGNNAISCKGTGSDYNVMTQGNHLVQTQYLSLENKEAAEVEFYPQEQLVFLYLSSGSIELIGFGLNQKLVAGMCCYVDQLDTSSLLKLKAKGPANIVLTEVWMDRKA
ncbi:MAG: HutD family protein [bacterium]|nr:HutD family protein [bacterium]